MSNMLNCNIFYDMSVVACILLNPNCIIIAIGVEQYALISNRPV